MHESELWITKLFNDYLGGVGNAALGLIGRHAERPWANFVTMELLVAACSSHDRAICATMSATCCMAR